MNAVARPVVFPLHGITEGRCACGWADCSRIGKHAACLWGDVVYGSAVPRPTPGAGVGLRTGAHPQGSDLFVIDVDSDDALEAWGALNREHGADPCPLTYSVKTPRGWHFYFKHPGFHVKNSAGGLGEGIDVRGDGGFVVAVGSPHRSGGTYEAPIFADLADAPDWLLEWLRQQPAPTEAQIYPGDVDGAELAYRRRLYAEYLKREAPPCVKGQGGDQILFNVVQRGAYDLALPVDDVLELVREHYDPRCSPPWGDELEERVHHKARDAKENSARPRAEPLPEDIAHLATSSPPVPVPPESGVQRAAVANDTKPEAVKHWSTRIKSGKDWDEPYVRPIYLLEGLIPRCTVTTFFAEGGSVKSWSALALAICVATGEPWLGRHSVPEGKALILDFEDGWPEFRRRKEILTKRRPDLDLSKLDYLYAGPNIADVELWKYLATQGYSLVVVDALNSGMPSGSDENDQSFSDGLKLAGRFVEGAQCNVLVVHHANKQGSMRGASAIRDQSDVVFKFEPVSETGDVKRMRMVCDKPGPQKRPAPVNVELSDAGLRTFEDEALPAAKAGGSSADVLTAASLLIAARGSVAGAVELGGLLGCTPKAALPLLRALEERGDVMRGHDKRVHWADEASQRRRILATVVERGKRLHSIAALAKRAAARAATVEDMIHEAKLARSSTSDLGHFFIPG